MISETFYYDRRKERVLKKVTQGSITSTLYLRGMSEYPLGEKTSTGMSRQYVYGPTGLIAAVDNSTTYYTFKDHLGSTRAVMNGATGTGVEYYAYDAWGAIMQSQVSPDIKYKYTSQELDGQTGIYNYRARMYDQSLGRFYATDPAGEGYSPYNYAANNPMSYVDPTGEDGIITWGRLYDPTRDPKWWRMREKEEALERARHERG
ncbi:MAG: RHS repeat-associated core domain-containing protein [Bacteroidetes bacterium]|nr:RHS repeat-associated core domain-containing protein [Bacteroidota bacterium]